MISDQTYANYLSSRVDALEQQTVETRSKLVNAVRRHDRVLARVAEIDLEQIAEQRKILADMITAFDREPTLEQKVKTFVVHQTHRTNTESRGNR